VLRGWFAGHSRHLFGGYGPERLAWYAALAELCAALTAVSSTTDAAHTLVELSWRRLLDEAGGLLEVQPPSRRDPGLAELGEPLAAVVTAAERCRTTAIRALIVRDVGGLGDEAVGWLIPALRAAASRPSERSIGGFEALAAESARRLRRRLSRPVRATGDWSIRALTNCPCDLCQILNDFLADQKRYAYEWPLAEQKRRHVHSGIDSAELPVSHVTRRQGRPYTLVLTKLETLFTDERTARTKDEADLAWLGTVWPSADRATDAH
jgi:hypothetical protein